MMRQDLDDFRQNQRGLFLLTVSRTLRSVAAGMINVAFPYYILAQLNHSALTIGLIYVAASIATALLSFAAGISADVYGKRSTLVVAYALLPLSATLVYSSASLWIIVPAAMLGGYSATGSLAGGGIGGSVQPIQSAVLAGLARKSERTKYFSLLTFCSGIAAALGALLSKSFSVQDVFLVSAIISALSIPALFFIKLPTAKGRIGHLKTRRTIGKFTLTGVFNGLSQGLVVPFLIPFFVLVYDLPKSEMSEYAFYSGLLASLAILGAPFLERHYGFVRSMVVTRGIGLILFCVLPLLHSLPVAILIYIVGPALRVAAIPIQQSALTKLVDEDEIGRALGMNQVARLAASSSGTAVSGYLMREALYQIPFFAYGIVMAINLCLYIKFFGEKKRCS